MELGLERGIGREALERHNALIGKTSERVFVAVREKQRKKLDGLIEERNRRGNGRNGSTGGAISQDKWDVNLSKHPLSEPEEAVLRKGLNFAPTTSKLPVVDVIASIECALRECNDVAQAEAVRGKIAGIMRRSVNSLPSRRRNITEEESKGLRSLREKEDIVIIPADKGNATVVMDSTDYTSKALAIVQNHPFERVKRCPARKIEDTVNKFLWNLFQQEGSRSLFTTNCMPPHSRCHFVMFWRR